MHSLGDHLEEGVFRYKQPKPTMKSLAHSGYISVYVLPQNRSLFSLLRDHPSINLLNDINLKREGGGY